MLHFIYALIFPVDDITHQPANLLFKIHIYESICKDENDLILRSRFFAAVYKIMYSLKKIVGNGHDRSLRQHAKVCRNKKKAVLENKIRRDVACDVSTSKEICTGF